MHTYTYIYNWLYPKKTSLLHQTILYIFAVTFVLITLLPALITHAAPSTPNNLQLTGTTTQPAISWDPSTTPPNGVDWTEATEAAAWVPRAAASALVFDNKMWIIGGWSNGCTDSICNDVWYSTDGITWTEATEAAAWEPRGVASALVFDDKMWIMGGSSNGCTNNSCNDVWYSTDGITWTEATDAAAWGRRIEASALVFDNKMWIMGGSSNGCTDSICNDVWYSTDGITWTEATDAAAWEPRGAASALVFDNKMWIMGGYGPCIDYYLCNDVWYSTDGITWTEATDAAAWERRSYASALVFDNKMWIIGGWAGTDWEDSNDVWFTSNQTLAYYEVCWDTVEGGCTNNALVDPDGTVLSAISSTIATTSLPTTPLATVTTPSWFSRLGQTLGILPNSVSAQATPLSYTFPSLSPGTYYASVTAYNMSGQSTSSASFISFTINPDGTITPATLADTGQNTTLLAILAIGLMGIAVWIVRKTITV